MMNNIEIKGFKELFYNGNKIKILPFILIGIALQFGIIKALLRSIIIRRI